MDYSFPYEIHSLFWAGFCSVGHSLIVTHFADLPLIIFWNATQLIFNLNYYYFLQIYHSLLFSRLQIEKL